MNGLWPNYVTLACVAWVLGMAGHGLLAYSPSELHKKLSESMGRRAERRVTRWTPTTIRPAEETTTYRRPTDEGVGHVVWVMNRLHTVHELDCWKVHKVWSNPDTYVAEADYTKMRAEDVPPGYHRCRDCAPGVG
jgi:hypothetical protein